MKAIVALGLALVGATAVAGEVRYLSAAGDDAADGRTPQSAWRTVEKLNADLPAGGTALLRRGDIFYGGLRLKAGTDASHPTVLADYGTGPKPVLSSVKIIRHDPSVWNGFAHGCWRTNLSDPTNCAGIVSQDCNPGFLLVDGEIKAWRRYCRDDVVSPWDFCGENGWLYVHAPKNPALLAKDIRVALNVHGVIFQSHTVISNIAVRATGAHGMYGGWKADSICEDVRISDCDFENIGGSELPGYSPNTRVRYGNGVEFGSNCRKAVVERCTFKGTYDVAVTMQGYPTLTSWSDIHVRDCTMTDCTQAFEVWCSKAPKGMGFERCSFTGNRTLRVGGGWGPVVRPVRACATPLLVYGMDTDTVDITVAGNTFEDAPYGLVFKSGGLDKMPAGYRIRDNVLRRVAGTEGKVRTFGPGTHYLTETAVFTAADSGSVWKAEPGAKPTISGARKVSGWRKAGNGLFVADVPWVTDRQRGFRQLVVDGSLRPRARHPNAGHFTSLDMEHPEGVTWSQWEYNYEKPRFHIKPGEVDPAWNLACGEVVFYHIWVDSHCPTASLTVDRGTNWLNLATAVRRNPCNSLWRLENLKEIADEPGEWALDFEAKKLYYRPLAGEDLTKAEVLAPDVQTLVRIDGARDVRFEGLTFADARFELAKGDRNDTQASYSVAAAVELTNAVNCVFADCTFTRLGGYALDFQAGTRDCRVTKCRLVQLGAGGVRLNATGGRQTAFTAIDRVARYQMPDPRVRVVGNEISDCEIADFGREFPSAVGVLCMSAEGTKITHNAIHDGYYTGVSVGWTWGYTPSLARDNEIDYNHIYNIGKGLLSDMGGIYTLGVSPGTKLRHNLIHDIDARYYGGWGIYPDEGSSGILIEDNVVYNTKFAPFHQHFGRNNTVRNNIFAGGRIDQLASSRWEPHTRFFFYNNIVWWQQGALHSGDWNDNRPYEFTVVPRALRETNTKILVKTTECDYNLYYNPKQDLKDVKWGTPGCTWDEWRTTYSEDKHSVWADPLFVDAAKHDYRLKPDSPAMKLGFRPIDLSSVGPRR